MAVTKTHPIKRALKAAIDYICNPEKTDAGDGDNDRFREAAEVTGKTVKQITNMVYRGKESLRRLLEREGITNAES
jgi:hypothetical protein